MNFKQWLLENEQLPGTEETHGAFLHNARENPHDDTNWLVYADYLEEQGHIQQAERIRWWIQARNAMKEENGGRKWDKSRPDPSSLHSMINDTVKSDWIKKLFGIEHTRHAAEKFGHVNHPYLKKVIGDAHHVAEKQALGLASPYSQETGAVAEDLQNAINQHAGDRGSPEWYYANAALHGLHPTTDNHQLTMTHHYSASNARRNAANNGRDEAREGQEAHNKSANAARSSFAALQQHMKENPPPE
jgi:uncharacterized protein (TIGR02996 family)